MAVGLGALEPATAAYDPGVWRGLVEGRGWGVRVVTEGEGRAGGEEAEGRGEIGWEWEGEGGRVVSRATSFWEAARPLLRAAILAEAATRSAFRSLTRERRVTTSWSSKESLLRVAPRFGGEADEGDGATTVMGAGGLDGEKGAATAESAGLGEEE